MGLLSPVGSLLGCRFGFSGPARTVGVVQTASRSVDRRRRAGDRRPSMLGVLVQGFCVVGFRRRPVVQGWRGTSSRESDPNPLG